MENKKVIFVPRPDGSRKPFKKSSSKESRKLTTLVSVLNVVIGILAAVLVIEFFVIASQIRNQNHMYYNEPRALSGTIKRGEFGLLVNFVTADRAKGIDESKRTEYGPFFAVADYYKAASIYKVYIEKGYADRAKEQLEKMEQYRQKMGDLDIFVEDIHQSLGIEM